MYVINKSVVAGAMSRLRSRKVHSLFPGYLHLQQQAFKLGRLSDLTPNFLDFYKLFFSVGDPPIGTPYIKPFTEQIASTKNLWLNENVAGTYAPSSIREGNPFERVVEIDRKARTYSLPQEHATLAKQHLVYNSSIPVADLAVFLYRDIGFLDPTMSISDLVAIFCRDFGYSQEYGLQAYENYRVLYLFDPTPYSDVEWLVQCHYPEGSLESSNGRTIEHVRQLSAFDLLTVETPTGGKNTPLQRLAVDGLLAFGEKTELSFGRLNILVGPNGSGKSSIIDCIRLLRFAPLDVQATMDGGGFDEWLYRGRDREKGTAALSATLSVPGIRKVLHHELRFGPVASGRILIEEALRDEDEAQEESVTYFVGSHRSGHARLSAAGSGSRRRFREMTESEYDPFQSILSQIRDATAYPEITKLAGLYGSFRIYSEWTFGRKSILREGTLDRSGSQLSEAMDNLPYVLSRLENTAAHERIRSLLREIKDSYRDYATTSEGRRIMLSIDEEPFDRVLPAYRLSDGTLRFLALASILLRTDPPLLICVEEPELGMHPDMIRLVGAMIIEAAQRTQVIISTHSEYLLTVLQDDFDVLLAFDKGNRGSVVTPLTRAEYVEWRADHELGELWSSGELGGVRY